MKSAAVVYRPLSARVGKKFGFAVVVFRPFAGLSLYWGVAVRLVGKFGVGVEKGRVS